MGYAVFHIRSDSRPHRVEEAVQASEKRLENEFYCIRFDGNGLILSIFDKGARREVVAPGARANVFQRFQDRPTAFDAWNIDEDALATATPITDLESARVLNLGPLAKGIRQVRQFGDSTIQQDICLETGSPLIRFDTTVDWRESWQMLKVAFPVDIHTDYATYEIQFGHVRRPTHRNTSWDRARFETCAHKWVDLSEPDYGVALLNESEYGHDIHENTIRLTLLKSSKSPDPKADMGTHHFGYALMPHAGDFRTAGVIQKAYEFNIPLTPHPAKSKRGPLPASHSFLSVSRPNIVVEAVKVEETGDRWVVRVYEAFGERCKARLTAGVPLLKVTECDLLERNHEPVSVRNGSFAFDIRPFEIKTFALKLK
jgi:alpha-mannosidase